MYLVLLFIVLWFGCGKTYRAIVTPITGIALLLIFGFSWALAGIILGMVVVNWIMDDVDDFLKD